MRISVYVYVRATRGGGGGHIYTDCYDWDRLNNSRGAPLNVALGFLGLLAFPPRLLTSQLDSDTAGTHVSEPLRAQLPEVRVQADRSAPRWPIGREAALLFFTSCCPSELAWGRSGSSWRTALMRQVAQWKFDAQCALYFVLCCWRSDGAAAEDGCFHDIKRNPWIILLRLRFSICTRRPTRPASFYLKSMSPWGFHTLLYLWAAQ